jgi:hypothetical protein
MSNERIDLTQIEAFLESAGPEAGGTVVYDLIAELKRCYDLIDRANESMKATREKVLSNTENWDEPLFQEVVDALLLLD